MTQPNPGNLNHTGETPMLPHRTPIPPEDFYVGYFEVPPALARFLRWLLPGLIVVAGAVAWFVSRAQNDPGDGVWHDDAQALVGRIAAKPYPLIRVPSSQPGTPVETILLVSEGKHGGGERVAALDGRIARVRGTILERDGRRLLELAENDAVAPDQSLSQPEEARLASPTAVSMGQVTLRGEIIDPKCYSGAMKPGEGKTHKECATLCIAGGIPPMFVTLDDAGRHSYYLLTNPAGEALEGSVLREGILPFVADAVEISGVLERCDDLQVLRIDPASIRRL
ncbi:MAG: hypothetical protein CHACPFDD_02089 [Phycisphaerae bacterium]|nr:hypothetical protein [Phycisphaerae bacterium]